MYIIIIMIDTLSFYIMISLLPTKLVTEECHAAYTTHHVKVYGFMINTNQLDINAPQILGISRQDWMRVFTRSFPMHTYLKSISELEEGSGERDYDFGRFFPITHMKEKKEVVWLTGME